jgi:hypothetical protein
MLKYDQKSSSKSWLKLVICFMIICLCTSGSVYLCCKIHWVAGVVVAIPIWILLVDVLINRRKSMTWYLLDFLRHTLIFAGTAVIAWYLWKIDWRIGAISILPVFILLLNIIGFLTLHIYYITPEASVSRKAIETLDQFERELIKNDSTERERKS